MSDHDKAQPSPDAAGTPTSAGRFRLPPTVQALGWVALLNDISSEAAYWILPQFLSSVLGAGTVAFGLIEGAAETVASFGRLGAGFLADHLEHRKPIAALGYTIANVAKPLLALTTSWRQVFWIRFTDRAAKGLRVPARDALIAESVSSDRRGDAFGFLQSMDTLGAIVGPLGAAALLLVGHFSLRTIFALAAIPGALTVLLAWFGVHETTRSAATAKTARRPGLNLGLRSRGLGVMLIAFTLFALGNSTDLFLVLRAQNLGVRPTLAPVLGLTFNVVYTVLSWPFGRLSDRVPRRVLVMAGYVVYALVYLGFARATAGWAAWLLFPCYGVYYALTEGVVKAWVADLAPAESRASVYGVFNWVNAVAAFPASVTAGWLWRVYGAPAPFEVSAALAFAAACLLLFA